jgi:hypothetical protein
MTQMVDRGKGLITEKPYWYKSSGVWHIMTGYPLVSPCGCDGPFEDWYRMRPNNRQEVLCPVCDNEYTVLGLAE